MADLDVRMLNMRADDSETSKPSDRRLSWSICLVAALGFLVVYLMLDAWEFFPAMAIDGFWISLGFGGLTGLVVNLLRPRYASTSGRWRAFYNFMLRQLPPPD